MALDNVSIVILVYSLESIPSNRQLAISDTPQAHSQNEGESEEFLGSTQSRSLRLALGLFTFHLSPSHNVDGLPGPDSRSGFGSWRLTNPSDSDNWLNESPRARSDSGFAIDSSSSFSSQRIGRSVRESSDGWVVWFGPEDDLCGGAGELLRSASPHVYLRSEFAAHLGWSFNKTGPFSPMHFRTSQVRAVLFFLHDFIMRTVLKSHQIPAFNLGLQGDQKQMCTTSNFLMVVALQDAANFRAEGPLWPLSFIVVEVYEAFPLPPGTA
ncbi:unnamed protein product [Diplocarpon coronariae]